MDINSSNNNRALTIEFLIYTTIIKTTILLSHNILIIINTILIKIMDSNNILRHILDIFEERRNIENNIDIYIESYYSNLHIL